MSKENNHYTNKTGADVPSREEDESSISGLLVQFIAVVIASPAILAYLILYFIWYVLKISYRDSIFNEFGRRIIYINNETFRISALKCIASLELTNFEDIESYQQNFIGYYCPLLNAIDGRTILNTKPQLYDFLRLFSKVGVFNYNERKHATLEIIKMNLDIIEQKNLNIHTIDDDSFSWKEPAQSGTKYIHTQFPKLWLLLVDTKPNEPHNFSSIGILTGSGHRQVKHDAKEADALFKAYGFEKTHKQPNANKPKRILSNFRYKANRALSRVKRGFQAKVLRQQVQLSRTRTRTKNKRAEEEAKHKRIAEKSERSE